MGLLIRWVLNTLALFVVAFVLQPHIQYHSWMTLFIAAAVLGILNTIVRPILKLVTFPITILTLGLFLLVLNGIMLELTAWLVPTFRIESFGWAVVAAILLSIVSFFTNRIGRSEPRRE